MSQTKKPKSFIAQDNQVNDQMVDFKSFVHLIKMARPFWFKMFVSIGLILSSSIFAIISARYMGELVESGLSQKDLNRSLKISGIILGFELLTILVYWLGRRALSVTACQFILSIRMKLFSQMHQLPMRYFDRQPQGRTVTRLTHDVESLEAFFSSSLGRLVSSIFTFFIALGAMIVTDFRLGLILSSLMIPAVVLTIVMRKKIRDLSRIVASSSSACNAKLSELINGIDVIRTFALEKWSKGEYDKNVQHYEDNILSLNTLFIWQRPLTNLLCSLPLIGLLFIGGKDVLAGTLSIGLFVAFIRYCERFSFPLNALTREIHVIQQAFTAAERITSFLMSKTEDQVLGQNGELKAEKISGQVEFKNVVMSYDEEKTILKNVSFKVLPGQKVGLAGRTGCGKTTTVSLLARLYQYQEGQIILDGHELNLFDRNSIRDNIGFVSQDVVIFKGSLKSNLTGEKDISEFELKKACEQTGLSLIMKTNGWDFDFELLDGGTNLSVGERQLISITRVVLKGPKILVLDEATAHIDPKLEEIVHQGILKVMEGKTCFLIAHRLKTLEACDKIIVFDEGKLVEEGSLQELLSLKGYYFKLLKHSQKIKNESLD